MWHKNNSIFSHTEYFNQIILPCAVQVLTSGGFDFAFGEGGGGAGFRGLSVIVGGPSGTLKIRTEKSQIRYRVIVFDTLSNCHREERFTYLSPPIDIPFTFGVLKNNTIHNIEIIC